MSAHPAPLRAALLTGQNGGFIIGVLFRLRFPSPLPPPKKKTLQFIPGLKFLLQLRGKGSDVLILVVNNPHHTHTKWHVKPFACN